MTDTDYLSRKLGAMADDAYVAIAQAVNQSQGEFSMHGALNGSRARLEAARIVREGCVEALRKMADLMISKDMKNPDLLRSTRDKLVARVVPEERTALFGNSAFDRTPQSERDKQEQQLLEDIRAKTELVIEDMEHDVVGDKSVKKSSQGNITIHANYSPVSVAGRDSNQTINITTSVSNVTTLLTKIEQEIPTLTVADAKKEEAKGLVSSLRTMLTQKLPAAGIAAVGVVLDAILTEGGSQLGKELLKQIGLDVGE